MIRILAVSDGHSHFENPIKEYEKRLDKHVKITYIKSEKGTDPKNIIKKETDRIIDFLAKETSFVILLDERGKSLDTKAFAKEVRTLLDRSENIIFIIGGAFGVDEDRLLSESRWLFRISDFVLPHSLALLVLLEQLYRIHEIWRGSKYHHE